MKVFDTIKDIIAILLLGLCGFMMWRYSIFILCLVIGVMSVCLNSIINIIYKFWNKFRTNNNEYYNKSLRQSSFENYCNLMKESDKIIKPWWMTALSRMAIIGFFILIFAPNLLKSIEFFSSNLNLQMMVLYYIAGAIFLLEGCYVILDTTTPDFHNEGQVMKENTANAVAKAFNAGLEDDRANICCTISQNKEHCVITRIDVCLIPEKTESALKSVKVNVETVAADIRCGIRRCETRICPWLTLIVTFRDSSSSKAVQINELLSNFIEKNNSIYKMSSEPSYDGCGVILTLERKSTYFLEKMGPSDNVKCIMDLALNSYKMAE